MKEKQFSIAEAADILGYKPHVIRYYEKEFELKIPRNKANHRYFTENEILTLKQIKELQGKGYNNTQIKMIMRSLDFNHQIYSHLDGVAASDHDLHFPCNDDTFKTVIENFQKEIIEEFRNQLEYLNQTMNISLERLTESVNELVRNLEQLNSNHTSKDPKGNI